MDKKENKSPPGKHNLYKKPMKAKYKPMTYQNTASEEQLRGLKNSITKEMLDSKTSELEKANDSLFQALEEISILKSKIEEYFSL